MGSWTGLDLKTSAAHRTHSHFAIATDVASYLQKDLGMGRRCSDSTEGNCVAELEWLPHERWVPAGSWASHLPTPVQVCESESDLNYQLQQEVPNFLTAPVSSRGMFQYCGWHCFPIAVGVTETKDEVCLFTWERHFNPHLKTSSKNAQDFYTQLLGTGLWESNSQTWVKCLGSLQNTETGGLGLPRRRNWR